MAINPFDWIQQIAGSAVCPWIRYPAILGSDLAGEVVEVGPGVTRFAVGDRVLGHAAGTDKQRNRAAEGAFQEYTVVLANLAAPIPSTLPYESAAVLPPALSTAACSLFQKDQLALQYPSATPTSTAKTLLIWGGSTSVGSNAIQLAVAAGYEVITTASPPNFDYVRRLGARQVFDYRSPTVVAEVIRALAGETLAGALAVGTRSAAICSEIVGACRGNKFVAMASPSVSFDQIARRGRISAQLPWLVLRLVASQLSLQVRNRIRGVRAKFIYGTSLMNNEVSRVIYEEFLPQALADGRYRAAPEPVVVGRGLDRVQAAMEARMQDVSARKLVVAL